MNRSRARRRPCSGVLLALTLGVGCSAELSFESGSATTSQAASSGDVASGTGASSASGDGDGDGGDTASPSSSGSSSDGGGGASSSPSSTGVTAVSSSVSTGGSVDCRTADECGDANPCTIDTCSDAGTCSYVGVAPGETGNAGEGSCPTGVCQTDQTCGLQVYSHPFDGETGSGTWSRQAVSEVWGDDPNAPPYVGIAAAVDLPELGVFAVFDEDGFLYVRSGDAWLAPTPAQDVFPGVDAAVLCTGALRFDAASAQTRLSLTVPGDPWDLAHTYDISPELAVSTVAGSPFPVCRTSACPLEQPEAGTPPPDAVSCSWGFIAQRGFMDGAPLGAAWEANGANVYRLGIPDLVWSEMPAATSPPMSAEGVGPSSADVIAAWWDGASVFFVAP